MIGIGLIIAYLLVAVLLYCLVLFSVALKWGIQLPDWARQKVLYYCLLWPWLLAKGNDPKGGNR